MRAFSAMSRGKATASSTPLIFDHLEPEEERAARDYS
jgi:hypothetical protein